MHEIELKFQVPASVAARVQQAVATSAAERTRLQAVYFDTDDRRLAAGGVALRLRREGTRWVQTLKAAGAGLARLEHDVALPGRGATPPPLDLSRHDGHPAGERLRALLAPGPAPALVERYRTDIRRWHRLQSVPGGLVELALDQGRIVAGGGHSATARPVRGATVGELEIELVRGEPAVLIEASRRWARRFGLWLDPRSKAERGDRLAEDRERVPARPVARLPRGRPGAVEACGAEAARSALGHLVRNAAEIADGLDDATHRQQLRLGLARLQAWWGRWPSYAVPADGVSGSDGGLPLGGVAGAGARVPLAERLGAVRRAVDAADRAGGDGLGAVLRGPEATALWLDLLALAHAAPRAAPGAPAKPPPGR